jgi:hypothetical protein
LGGRDVQRPAMGLHGEEGAAHRDPPDPSDRSVSDLLEREPPVIRAPLDDEQDQQRSEAHRAGAPDLEVVEEQEGEKPLFYGPVGPALPRTKARSASHATIIANTISEYSSVTR